MDLIKPEGVTPNIRKVHTGNTYFNFKSRPQEEWESYFVSTIYEDRNRVEVFGCRWDESFTGEFTLKQFWLLIPDWMKAEYAKYKIKGV